MPDESRNDEVPEGGSDAIDYTQFEAPPPDTLAPPPVSKPFDPEPQRERIRGVLALVLVSLVVLLALGTYVFLAVDWLTGDDIQTLSPVFTALVTLTGTAVGFYFGGGKGGAR